MCKLELVKYLDKLGLSCAKLRANLVWHSLVWYKFSQKIFLVKKNLGKKKLGKKMLVKLLFWSFGEKNFVKKKFG